ncbi:DUF2339 domain-containing protein [Hyphomicrobium sp. D-2]|uniref:DUF2339 domain-containing protein n=1 Tax=Hyphomicrobium sp. D-2 TaxID=3041621 RepID=UPI0024562E85|nr:DUF2339 domain-containing protein [Hyphomicrobium sp. D-2]MDH4982865.1 DUF2339 domain-containing protein [Hyphomicrobium sp. D-2]
MLATLILIAVLTVWLLVSGQLTALKERLAKAEAAIRALELELQGAGVLTARAAAEPEPLADEQSAQEPAAVEETPQASVPQAPVAPALPTRVSEQSDAHAPGFEERIGTRWAVWVGGAALAVGGIFLVNYSIEAGLIGPTTRVVFGALFALALVGAGEWMRRGERALPMDIVPTAHIPGILTAAGTMVLFGTIYAAHALYGLIGSGTAFVLLGAAGLTTMLASALHGPALAGIGLVGAMVTPLLVSSSEPNPWALVIFLAIISASALGLARLRRWLWLALVNTAGVVLWGIVLAQPDEPWVSAAFAHTLIQLALASVCFAVAPHTRTPDAEAQPDWIAVVSLGALTLLVTLVLFVSASAGADAGWGLFAASAMAILAATAWLSAPSAVASVFAGVVAIAVALLWRGVDAPPPESSLWPAVGAIMRLPDVLHVYFPFVAFSSLAVSLVAAMRLHNGRELPVATAALYALAATVPPLAALTVAYLRITQFDGSIPFALFGLVLAFIFADAASRFQNSEGDPPSAVPHLAAGAFAAAAIAALSFALVAMLDRGYLTVAFALSALGVSYVATQKRIPVLRYAAAALGVVVLGRVAWDPVIMGAEVGSWPIFNWLLVGYGVPAVCFAFAARLLRRDGDDFAVRCADSLSIIFAGLLAFFQIRHLTNGGDPLVDGSSMIEQGLITFVSLGFAAGLLRLDLGRANAVFRAASYAFTGVAIVSAIVGLGVAWNPYIRNEPVTGGWIVNDLLLGYLLPSLMALYLARISRSVRPRWYTVSAASLSFVLAFLYVTLNVRHLFHGANIGFMRPTTGMEQWAYSVAWLALGLVLLAYGIWRGSSEARLASGVLVLMATLKVFLFDLSGVDGIWRALSFICLGVVLIGIGLAYQRVLFARPRPQVDLAGDGEPTGA